MSLIYEPKGRAGEYAQLALNIYQGCGHQCRYCYVQKMPGPAGNTWHQEPKARDNLIDRLSKELNSRSKALTAPITLSFTSDAYQPIEAELGLTRRVITLLKHHGLRVEVLTKGGARACRDLDLLGPEDAMAATLTFTDEKDSAEWEPGAAPPAERMEMLARAKEHGIRTWASFEPVIDPEQTFRLMREVAGVVDLYKVGKMNYRGVPVDWEDFAHRALDLLQELGVDYYIKKDLRSYIGDRRPETTRADVPEAQAPEDPASLF